MAAIDITNVITLSMAFCKAQGLLVNNAVTKHTLTFRRGNRALFDMVVVFDMANNYTVRFVYEIEGHRYDYTVALRYCSSNLNRGGYYYFVCPVTGLSCRKLYFVNNRFVGRCAFRTYYPQQMLSHKQRTSGDGFAMYCQQVEQLLNQPYRKETYNGKLTPFGRRLHRLNRGLERTSKGVRQDIQELIAQTHALIPF